MSNIQSKPLDRNGIEQILVKSDQGGTLAPEI